MEMIIEEPGVIRFKHAHVIFKNFSGMNDKFKKDGSRGFSVVIEDEDQMNALISEGYHVKVKERDDGEKFMRLDVKVKTNRPRNFQLKCGKKITQLDEETLGILDDISIINWDFIIVPWDWDFNGQTGRAAIMDECRMEQRVSRYVDPEEEEYED